MNKRLVYALLCLPLLISLGACDLLPSTKNDDDIISASGTIEAREVAIAPEIGGKVISVSVEEGDTVEEGDVLLRLDDGLLQAQYDQAAAVVDVAGAAVEAAKAQLESAQIQYEIALQTARFQEQPGRVASWQDPISDDLKLPAWYFAKKERISAAEAEVGAAKEALDVELANLEIARASASGEDFVATEERLAKAQATLGNARQTLLLARAAKEAGAREGQRLVDVAQDQLDSAEAEREAAELAYDRILSTSASDEVLEARARAAVAQVRYDNAVDQFNQMLTGEDSLQVKGARVVVEQAEAAVAQAEASLAQYGAALDVLNVQIAKAVIYAPSSGVILTRNVQVGETAAPGGTVMVIGQLDEVTLTVYVPEDKYGRVQLGQEADITVDSFPSRVFTGTVIHISDKAEFTPRNVQTVEGRLTTVYAVDIRVPNPDLDLKPGVPADVTIDVGS